MINNRLYYIDILKGFAILCVVAGHIATYNTNANIIIDFVYSFHMPLFFFISGFLYSLSKSHLIKEEIIKKSKTLIIPYFSISIIACMVHGISKETLYGYFVSETRWGYWFLPTLFLLFLIMIVIYKFSHGNERKLISMIISVEVGLFFFKQVAPIFINDFCLMRILVYYFHYLSCVSFFYKLKPHFIIITSCFFICIILIYLNIKYKLNNELLRTIGRFSAIFSLFYSSQIMPIEKMKKAFFLQECGKCSLIIYMFHYFMLPIISPYFSDLSNMHIVLLMVLLLSLALASVCINIRRNIIDSNSLFSLLFLGRKYRR